MRDLMSSNRKRSYVFEKAEASAENLQIENQLFNAMERLNYRTDLLTKFLELDSRYEKQNQSVYNKLNEDQQ